MVQPLIVGTIGRPHGLRGEVTVRPRTDRIEERFAVGSQVQVNGQLHTVTRCSSAQGRLVVALAGIADRTAAETLRGQDVWVIVEADDLAEEEFHDTTLIGLAAQDPNGGHLGEVIAVAHHPAQDLLVLRTPQGERLVPFVAALVPCVEPAAGRVVINPIPGLLSEVSDED